MVNQSGSSYLNRRFRSWTEIPLFTKDTLPISTEKTNDWKRTLLLESSQILYSYLSRLLSLSLTTNEMWPSGQGSVPSGGY